MSQSANGQRRRGIRASRARLSRALAGAGLKTQAQLAERIADLEGLESVPKDLVSRAFRELPVEARSLERIARALDVDAVELYKRHPPKPAPAASAGTGRYSRILVLWAAVVTLAIALGVVIRLDGPGTPDDEARSDGADFPVLDTGRPSLLVLPFDGDPQDRLAPALRERLGATFAVASGPATLLMAGEDPLAAASRLRIERVVEGEVISRGRFAGLRMYVIADGLRRQVWAESTPLARLDEQVKLLADRFARALEHGLPGGAGDSLPHFPLAPVQDDYLEGRYFLDRPASELNLTRAQARFASALRRDSNYALAHAGLCEALLEEHWMSDEQRALDDAALACGRALQLAPDDPMVRAAHAQFLRLTGRLEESIGIYEDVLGTHPDDAHLLAGYAFTLLQQFRQIGDDVLLDRAIDASRRASESDPGHWKAPFFEANMHYFAGDLESAVSAAESALARDENEMVLANLGTFRFCFGDVEGARTAYLRAAELAPHSYVGDEFMGMVHYYLGEFADAVRLRRRAIESVAAGSPEIHQMWGNLADAQRHAGDPESAAESYLRAIKIVERDLMRGTAADADRAARIWYYTALGGISREPAAMAGAEALDAEIEALATGVLDSTGHLRLAQSWQMRNRPQKARAALQRAASTCRVHRLAPDLLALGDAQLDAAVGVD